MGVLLCFELILRLFLPIANPLQIHFDQNKYVNSAFPINYHVITEAEEGLPGIIGKKHFSTNNKGFRGDSLIVPKPVNEFRIFMIGGSTTECFYLDDKEAISAILQMELANKLNKNIKVYNAGKSGDATPNHIAMLTNRITHLQPDMIILFAGFNDLLRSINHYDYTHYQSGRIDIPEFLMVCSHLQLFRRLYLAYYKIKVVKEQQSAEMIFLKTQVKQLANSDKKLPAINQAPTIDKEAYLRNLKTIVGVARAHNLQFMLMTQQATWNSQEDTDIKNWHWLRRGYSEKQLAFALDSLNHITKQVATEFDVPLYDLADEIPKTKMYFYDDCHFNTNGAKWAGVHLAAFVEKIIKL